MRRRICYGLGRTVLFANSMSHNNNRVSDGARGCLDGLFGRLGLLGLCWWGRNQISLHKVTANSVVIRRPHTWQALVTVPDRVQTDINSSVYVHPNSMPSCVCIVCILLIARLAVTSLPIIECGENTFVSSNSKVSVSIPSVSFCTESSGSVDQ